MNPIVEPERLLAAAAIATTWIVWTILVLRRARRAKGDREAATVVAETAGAGTPAGSPTFAVDASSSPLLLAVASQTGVAAALAGRTAQRLRAAGVAVRVESLGRLDESSLRRAGRALFVASTCGEGDAPDEAFGFVRRMSNSEAGLHGFGFALLALGDSSYANFCAFGRRLESWLLERGASPLWERIDVDGADTAALQRWDEAVLALAGADTAVRAVARAGALAGDEALPAGHSAFSLWRLVSREQMNPGSVGEPILRVHLEPSILPTWQPGDLARLRIPASPAAVLRDFSIASLPEDGRIELFVRLQRHGDGRPGLASGWLSGADATALQPGGIVELRLRPNPGFRLAGAHDSPLILIGSGSGLDGLRALLRARERDDAGPNWLIFGERNEAHDFLCRDEILTWQATGVLERFDAVFSRDGGSNRYVQHRLVERADTLRRWIAKGAAIHVCGSRERLGVGVDEALAGILGDEAFASLRESGRYRRDVW
ncbi:MAG: oxidoreductase [Limnobacter sp.]|nr:oxidoreductase [Limnobacter sp.]